jgi:ribonuclease R
MIPAKEDIVRFLHPSSYGPTSLRNLILLLGIKKRERQDFKKLIKDMLKQGILVRTKGKKIALPIKPEKITGKLMMTRKGYGFVVSEQDGVPDILIRSRDLKDAFHKDRVVARIEGYKGKERKPWGKIQNVIERGSKTIVGRFWHYGKQGYLQPLEEEFLQPILIPPGQEMNAAENYYAVAEIIRYPGAKRPGTGRIIEVLGSPDEPNIEDQLVIRMFDLPREFPQDVLDEASNFSSSLNPEELRQRKDFRQKLIITVDPQSAKDFDDAVHIEVKPDGSYELGVHIADVSHYVTQGSAIDQEAFHRGNSYYFTDFALPMLPERLSSELCSLKPQEDRLTLSMEMTIDQLGRERGVRFYKGLIKSSYRMTYHEVAEFLNQKRNNAKDGGKDLRKALKTMAELALLLHKRRKQRGSIDFDFPEPEILTNPLGKIKAIIKAERNIAHQIIEEFMLAANRAVAKKLKQSGFPAIYRIHEPPDPIKVEEFSHFLSALGYGLSKNGNAQDPRIFQRLLQKIEGKPEENIIARRMLRVMKLAQYSDKNKGHFALAFPMYTHFTSPIRRYPDLIVHHLLKESLWSGSLSSDDLNQLETHLSHIAHHCSDTERIADEAERKLMDWKRVRFMSQKLGEDFTAYISDMNQYGIYAELEEYFVEGFIPISTLLDDYYIFNKEKLTLKGQRSKKLFKLGQKIRVRVVRANIERAQVEFSLIA